MNEHRIDPSVDGDAPVRPPHTNAIFNSMVHISIFYGWLQGPDVFSFTFCKIDVTHIPNHDIDNFLEILCK